MKPIIFPLKLRMQGPDVGDLQAALALFELPVVDQERSNQRFGKSTRQSVSKFQSERQLDVTGVIDEATAGAMNNVLTELGALDDVPPGQASDPARSPTAIIHCDEPRAACRWASRNGRQSRGLP